MKRVLRESGFLDYDTNQLITGKYKRDLMLSLLIWLNIRFAWSYYWNWIERWLWLQPHWNWKGFSFLATFTTGWADALGVHPFNHSHCRFLPQSTTPGKTWWFHDTFNQHQTHNISVTKAAKPRIPPPRLTLAELEFYPNISPRQIFC